MFTRRIGLKALPPFGLFLEHCASHLQNFFQFGRVLLRGRLKPLLDGFPVADLLRAASRRDHGGNQARQFPGIALQMLHSNANFFGWIIGVSPAAHQFFQNGYFGFHGAQQSQPVFQNLLLGRIGPWSVVMLRIV